MFEKTERNTLYFYNFIQYIDSFNRLNVKTLDKQKEKEPNITLEEYFRIDGTSQEEIEKELIQQVLDILSERWIKANETKSAFTTDNLGIIEIEKSI